MAGQPSFSFLMASYNNARFLATAIRSVLGQTCGDWELLIADDCSTDESLAVIEPFLADPRLRLFALSPNRGYVGVLNQLFAEARAPLAGIIDSDDALDRTAMAAVLSHYAADPQLGLAYSRFVYCDEELRPLRPGFSRPIPPGSSALHENCVSAWRTFRLEAFRRTSGFDPGLPYAEDKDIIFKMEEVGRLAFVNLPLYLYRLLPHSQGHDPRKRALGLLSFAEARWRAWQRRQGKAIPNLSEEQIANVMFSAALLARRLGERERARDFLARARGLRSLDPGWLAGLVAGPDRIARAWPPEVPGR